MGMDRLGVKEACQVEGCERLQDAWVVRHALPEGAEDWINRLGCAQSNNEAL